MPSKLLKTYMGSKELKKLVIQRSEELQIPFRYICHDIGINYKAFMNGYINSNAANAQVTEGEFEKMLTILGINVRFQFVVEKDYRASGVQQELKDKYEKFKNTGNDFGEEQVTEETGDTPSFNGDY